MQKSYRFLVVVSLLVPVIYSCSGSPGIVFEKDIVSSASSVESPSVSAVISSPQASSSTNPSVSSSSSTSSGSSTSPSTSSSASTSPSPSATATPGPTPTPLITPSATPTPTPTVTPGLNNIVQADVTSMVSFGSKLYVADKFQNKVHIINSESTAIEKSIIVSSSPKRLRLKPDGTKLYVASSGSASIDIINISTQEKEGTITAEDKISEMVVSNTIAIVSYIDTLKPPSAYNLSTKTKLGNLFYTTDTGSVSIPNIKIAEMDKNGKTLYILGSSSLLYKMDLSTSPISLVLKSNSTSILGFSPKDIKISPDSSKLYISSGQNYVQVIDSETFSPLGELNTVNMPTSINITADGNYVVTTQSNNEVRIFDASTYTVKDKQTFSTTNYILGLATISGDGKRIFGVQDYSGATDNKKSLRYFMNISSYSSSPVAANSTEYTPSFETLP